MISKRIFFLFFVGLNLSVVHGRQSRNLPADAAICPDDNQLVCMSCSTVGKCVTGDPLNIYISESEVCGAGEECVDGAATCEPIVADSACECTTTDCKVDPIYTAIAPTDQPGTAYIECTTIASPQYASCKPYETYNIGTTDLPVCACEQVPTSTLCTDCAGTDYYTPTGDGCGVYYECVDTDFIETKCLSGGCFDDDQSICNCVMECPSCEYRKDPNNQSGFVYCGGDNDDIHMTCGEGNHFDQGICDCVDGISSTIAPSSGCQDCGYYQDQGEEDCKIFFECKDGEPTTQELRCLGDGTCFHYNEISGECGCIECPACGFKPDDDDIHGYIDCNSGVDLASKSCGLDYFDPNLCECTSTAPVDTNTGGSTSKDSTSTDSTSTDSTSSDSTSTDSTSTDSTSTDSTSTASTSTASTSTASTSTASTSTASTVTTEPGSGTCPSCGFKPIENPDRCEYNYISCETGSDLTTHCPTDYCYDESSCGCKPESFFECPACGLKPDPNDPTRYISCDTEVDIPGQCGGDLEFDANQCQCLDPSKTTTTPDTTSTETITTSTETITTSTETITTSPDAITTSPDAITTSSTTTIGTGMGECNDECGYAEDLSTDCNDFFSCTGLADECPTGLCYNADTCLCFIPNLS